MAVRRRQWPWHLACALYTTLAAGATISASNSSTNVGYGGTITLQNQNTRANMSTLVPLTQGATIRTVVAELFLANDSSYPNIDDDSIAFISCDSSAYPGNIQPANVFTAAYQSNKLSGVILYGTETDYCNYTNDDPSLQQFPVYSMTNRAISRSVRDGLLSQNVNTKQFVTVGRSNSNGDPQNGARDNTQPNPLGPSPSTAVAMIILYSITGVITALFLVIIITGAVRAHRHPDRYGPRDVLGRPRQSRARGLGRAILDTIPIVKFGERESTKPADVELGSTAEARDVNTAETQVEGDPHHDKPTTEARIDGITEVPRDTSSEQVREMESGIAPAQPALAGVAATQTGTSADEGLGCSICTDDFEKGQDIRVLPCNHKFHPECVDPWLLNVSGTCPLCRVDLRPVSSHTSAESNTENADTLAPPLQSDTDVSHRRRSALRDILSFRSRPNASTDERISALRRLREQRRDQSGDVATGSANASTDDVANHRRSKRMSARLSGVFTGRRRGGRDESPQPGEPSSSQQPPPREDESSGAPPSEPSSQSR